MFRITVAALMLGASAYTCAQSSISCCSPKATESFADLGNDESFVSVHQEPVKMVSFAARGSMMNYAVTGGDDGQAYYLKANSASNNWLFVIHEWWGLNEHIKKQAEALQDSLGNVHVICLDLYDGKNTDKREEASALMSGAKEERIEALIEGAIAFAGTEASIATVGWCFGGGWSLQTALLGKDQATSCVVYYGMPEQNLKKLAALNAPVLGIFASEDKWINPKVVENFEANMVEAMKELETVTFQAEHAFANPSNPQYDAEATSQAMRLTLDFISSLWKE